MRARSAEAERAHAGEAPPAISRQRRRLTRDEEIKAGEVDVRVGLVEMQRLRRQIVLQREHRFHEACEARSRLGMTDVGLDRADRQRADAGLTQDLAECSRFDRIAGAGSSAMGLDISERVRRDP